MGKVSVIQDDQGDVERIIEKRRGAKKKGRQKDQGDAKIKGSQRKKKRADAKGIKRNTKKKRRDYSKMKSMPRKGC